MGFVFQDSWLFSGTLRENISLGDTSLSDQEVLEILKKSGLGFAEETVDTVLDMPIQDRGSNLSGGQKQRIAIARAILKNAPILLLDEATSALDSESERLVQSALDNLMTNKTSIVVAHRLSTIKNADKIVVLENGILVEQGNQKDLLSANGVYANIYRSQIRNNDQI